MKIKRIIMGVAIAMAGVFTASASDTFSRDISTLPTVARELIAKHFKANVSLIKVDKTLGHIDEYDVVLTDGTEISFDNKGNMKEVETSEAKAVPKGLVPAAITNYVASSHKGQHIVSLERKRSGWEVELSNGIDIRFDKEGRFVRYDD
ncbi:PepSY-like domain-containing protein [uncultured Muribaculum sp.]|uniref:PepSY-like domain-containing protein n=1 Tax=uncultured Muribaculum sp. TaxID=1918613 RepID=UPI0025F5D834|nr:PepSY-like domain-containing protein [uncultured Muribaculum sp.]